MKTQYDAIVIGGGPAGLMAAIVAGRAGRSTLVLEKMETPGKKLLATGGGHCNLTNTLPLEELARRYGKQWRFTLPALQALTPQALRDFFADRGVPTASPDGLHVFPVSNRASDVLQALVSACLESGVDIATDMQVKSLILAGNRISGVMTEQGAIAAPQVVIACGGKSYSGLGANGSGYKLARQADHTIVEPVPALVELCCLDSWPATCSGIAIKEVELEVRLPKKPPFCTHGPILFTHQGISGPAALDISATVAELLLTQNKVEIYLRLFPGKSADDWLGEFDNWQREQGNKSVVKLVAERLPARLADIVCQLAGCDTQASHFPKEARRRLASLLSSCRLEINGTAGFDRAMSTRGGISLKEIDPHTMASKRTAGLYFAGEVIDIDGPCGGFSLQWAFSSGYLAGRLS